MAENKEKRKTYSIETENARLLARMAITFGEKLNRTVARQSVLDALIQSLNDPSVFSKIKKLLENNCENK